jgi:hypothetical protein
VDIKGQEKAIFHCRNKHHMLQAQRPVAQCRDSTVFVLPVSSQLPPSTEQIFAIETYESAPPQENVVHMAHPKMQQKKQKDEFQKMREAYE